MRGFVQNPCFNQLFLTYNVGFSAVATFYLLEESIRRSCWTTQR
jgi:hypothetical protein